MLTVSPLPSNGCGGASARGRMSDDREPAPADENADLEREIRAGRKFSLSEAIGRMAGGGVMKRRVAGQPQASGRAGHPGLPAQPLRAWRLRRRPERPRNWARWSSRRGCASSSRTPRACWRTSPTTIAAAASPSPMSGSSCSRCTRLAAQCPLELADLGVGAAPTLSALTSQSLSASAYKLPEVREELFQLLYKQIEQAALEAGLASIGVPFIDAVTPATDMAVVPTPSAPTEPQPTSTYVVRQVRLCQRAALHRCRPMASRRCRPGSSTPRFAHRLRSKPASVMSRSLCDRKTRVRQPWHAQSSGERARRLQPMTLRPI